jgi:hypothetical protein
MAKTTLPPPGTPAATALQMRIAVEVDKLAAETVAPLLARFERDKWPADYQAIVIDAVITKLIIHLKQGGRDA